MLRLFDHRTGRAETLPAGPGLRVQILDGAGRRAPVVADLLRRVAQRAGRRVRVVSVPRTGDDDLTDYGVAPFEVLAEPLPNADVYVSPGDPPGKEPPGLCLRVPRETGAGAPADATAVRLAMLETPHREPLELSARTVSAARDRLGVWRGRVAEWARSPSRPLDREYAAQAETALADDLDAAGALAVLDRLAADPGVPPGAKFETVVHVDMMLALGLVSAVGNA